MSVRLGLIGHNIAYSKSTDIFASIFRSTGQTGTFELFDFPPEELPAWLKNIAPKLNGFAATIPHKQMLMRHVDHVDERAGKIGAVNSVAVRGQELHGFNTDYTGIVATLNPTRERFTHKTALVLGTGGSARTVMHALVREFAVPRFLVASRSVSSAERFRTEHERKLGGVEIEIGLLNSPHWSMAEIGLIVNCTPLAGFNHPDELPPLDFAASSHAVYFDLNYNRPNQAIAVAREAGLHALDGSRMLVEQAVASYKLWTGTEVDGQGILEDIFPET
jgi:shikimate dehydrogenase